MHYRVFHDDLKTEIAKGTWEINAGDASSSFTDIEGKTLFVIHRVQRLLTFWKRYFEIFLYNPTRRQLEIKPVNIFKGHWRLIDNNDIYDFYIHKGHRKSLFKNEKQIASFDKKRLSIFEQNCYTTLADNGVDRSLLIAFSILLDIGEDNDSSTFTFDFGSLTSGVKKVDENWQPR
jgi:hypothetical protein